MSGGGCTSLFSWRIVTTEVPIQTRGPMKRSCPTFLRCGQENFRTGYSHLKNDRRKPIKIGFSNRRDGRFQDGQPSQALLGTLCRTGGTLGYGSQDTAADQQSGERICNADMSTLPQATDDSVSGSRVGARKINSMTFIILCSFCTRRKLSTCNFPSILMRIEH